MTNDAKKRTITGDDLLHESSHSYMRVEFSVLDGLIIERAAKQCQQMQMSQRSCTASKE